MTVTVVDLQHVEIDGKTVGCVADAMANFRDQAGAIQAALVEWSQGFAEEAVRHAGNTLQESLDKANSDLAAAGTRNDQLTAQLASQQQAYVADCNAIRETYESQLQQLNQTAVGQVNGLRDQLQATAESYQKQINELVASANQQIGTLQATVQKSALDLAWHQRRANLATEMINHLYTGDSQAAVSSTLELRRIELTARQAQLDAEKAQLEPVAG